MVYECLTIYYVTKLFREKVLEGYDRLKVTLHMLSCLKKQDVSIDELLED